MFVTFVGGFIMATRQHHKKGENEREIFDRREMRHHFWREHHDGFRGEEGEYRHERFGDWNREENEGVKGEEGKGEGKMESERGFHHRWHHEGRGYGNWGDRGNEKKDSTITNKVVTPKK